MTYTGEVRPGGPAQVRELAKLVLTKVAVGPMNNNVYLLRCRTTGDQLMIDAATDPDVLLSVVGSDGLSGIVTTHRHGDHTGALAAVAAATGATTYASEADGPELPVPPDVVVADGDVVTVGACALTAITLVGHTPGGLALAYDDPDGHVHLFTGDSLFPGGVGNTWGDDDAFRTLLADVTAKVFDIYSDETWIYPGHGADTTVGAERGSLTEWAARGW